MNVWNIWKREIDKIPPLKSRGKIFFNDRTKTMQADLIVTEKKHTQ